MKWILDSPIMMLGIGIFVVAIAILIGVLHLFYNENKYKN